MNRPSHPVDQRVETEVEPDPVPDAPDRSATVDPSQVIPPTPRSIIVPPREL